MSRANGQDGPAKPAKRAAAKAPARTKAAAGSSTGRRPPAKSAADRSTAKKAPAKKAAARKAPAKKLPVKRGGPARKAAPSPPPESSSSGSSDGGGEVLAAVEAFVASLDLAPEESHRLALAALAKAIAVVIDAGAGLATAAVSRELRATLEELDDDDLGEDGELTDWEDDLGVAV